MYLCILINIFFFGFQTDRTRITSYNVCYTKLLRSFQLIQKVTTSENVVNSFIGERDNVKPITTKDTSITIQPLQLDVKPLPQGTQLVGDFTLDSEFKNHKANAYKPLNATIVLNGTGYYALQNDLTFIPKSNAYTLFKSKPQVDRFYTDKGAHINTVYSFALSANESFLLPEVVITSYSIHYTKLYECWELHR